MASIIKIKRSSGTALPSNLHLGELAVTYGTGTQGNNGDRLLVGTGGVDENGYANNIDVVGGKYFTDMLDHAAGTLTANSAIIVDGNSKIDVLNVDNITLDGNTISTSSGNLTLNPVGSIDANNNTIINVAQPTNPTDVATKAYVDAEVGASTINLSDGSTTSLVDLGDSDVEFVATTTNAADTVNGDITTSVVDNQVLFGIRDTLGAAGAGSAGSATQVPVITVNRKGQITALSSQAIASTLSVAGDGSTSATVNLLTDTLTFAGGTGIASVALDAVDDTTDTVTVTADIASTSQVGVASFAAADFNVSGGGEVTISSVSNDQLAGSIANGKLANSSIAVTDGSTSNDIALGGTITFAAGEGMDVTQAGGTVTIAAELATETNAGVATFDGTHFDVTAGDVTIADGAVGTDQLAGTLDLTGKSVTLAPGEISNGELANSSISINSNSVSLGGSVTLTTSDIAEGTNEYYTSAKADSDARNALSVTTLAASGDGSLTYNEANGEFTFTPAEAGTDILDNLVGGTGVNYDTGTFTISIGQDVATTANVTFADVNATGNVTVDGNLTVQGTTTTLNTETLTTTDPLMHLADSNTTTDAVDIGFIGRYSDNGADVLHTGFFRDATDGKYRIFNNVADADLLDNANVVDIAATGYEAAGMVVGALEATTLSGQYLGADSDITVGFAARTTDDLAEGTNEYFTVVKARNAISGSGAISYTAGSGVIAVADAAADGATKGVATFNATNFADDGSGTISTADITLAGGTGSAAATLGETLTITGSGPVSTSATGTTLTVAVADATTASKGIASFASANFDVASGNVTTKDITFSGSQGADIAVTNGGTLEFVADSRSGTAATGINVVNNGSGQFEVRQVNATTTQRGAALFNDSDFTMESDVVRIGIVDGGEF